GIKSVPGFIGPAGLPEELRIIRDQSTEFQNEWIAGANEKDYHLRNYIFQRNCDIIDCAVARAGDPSPEGDGVLKEIRGIEVGHIFKLGYKYSKTFNVSVLDEKGKAVTPVMGTYGIGVSRTVAAVIEQNHDEKGIIWPVSIAPFDISLVSITKKPEELKKIEDIYQKLLEAGFDVFWDDRNERPGVKFIDAELIGFPIRLTAGKTFFENGNLEVLVRSSGEKSDIDSKSSNFIDSIRKIKKLLENELLKLDDLHENS
ncbi:MAG: His/Gly/Thr/Pro-type tRNA ligase C-terminal domain-containing protein, partial [Spirochaetia bacterium]|nr:His/Gly/Thr/Pro-type tRNA ligase C-terminal domain-containing protein [Spirochaetia bacterium]